MKMCYIPVGVLLLVMMVVGDSDQFSGEYELDAMLNSESAYPSNGVVYRWYKSGDTLSGVNLADCLDRGNYCYVAVDTTGGNEARNMLMLLSFFHF